MTIPHQLYFARRSDNWGGSVAFISTDAAPSVAFGRMYRIARVQFEHVVRWENGGEVIDVPWETLAHNGFAVLDAGWYNLILNLGQCDGVPVYTFTSSVQPSEYRAPSPAYLRMIAKGLREAYEWDTDQISRYLSQAPGIEGVLSPDQLLESIE